MQPDDAYVRDTHQYDRLLTRSGFVRICDYERLVTPTDIDDFQRLVDTVERERPVHAFLADHLHLVVNAEVAHGCRWIKSNPTLGGERSPDFMIARRDSSGLRWTLIELQDPKTDLFLHSGRQGGELREGIQQVGQWRDWVRRWGSNSVRDFGYPLLRNDFRAVVVIGRSEDKRRDLRGDERIAALEQEHRIEIRSYDYITRAAWQALHGCGVDHNVGL